MKSQNQNQNQNTLVNNLSYSAMSLFSTNPIMFKIRYINLDKFDTTTNISGVTGNAFHTAMNVYNGGIDTIMPKNESEAIEYGLKAGMEYLDQYPENFIKYSKTIATKQKAFEKFAFGFNSYVQEKPKNSNEEIIASELLIESDISVDWDGKKIELPIPLKGYIDQVFRTDGKLKVRDYKTCASFSNPEKIDGRKILQAVQYYFLVYAEFGEAPYSMVFDEVKLSQNRDKGPQVRSYEIVYADYELFFDFYLRFYSDIVRALSGEAVFIPNINSFFDNEVAILAYIHRLDMSEEQAELMKQHNVDNLTDLLKKKLSSAGNMRKLLKTVEENFTSAKSLNYKDMKNHDKIKTKLMEYGMLVEFDSLVEGASVDLYRYTPSIGLKMSRLESFTKDIEQVLGVSGIRVLAPIRNSSMIGFEVPKENRYFPALPESNKTFDLKIGQDVLGDNIEFDIREAPHMLVAGATGSGKSVFLNSIIEQLKTIPNAELHLFDPKMVELAFYEDDVLEYKSDHLEISLALEDLVIEMDVRYELMKKNKVRNIKDLPSLNYKFVVIDEFGDLVLNSKKVAKNVLLLAQKARAAGIHIIIATQRPSVDIISGTIKANFPTKVAFRMAKETDSRVILDQSGAEKLLGKGDMLFSTGQGVERLQGFDV